MITKTQKRVVVGLLLYNHSPGQAHGHFICSTLGVQQTGGILTLSNGYTCVVVDTSRGAAITHISGDIEGKSAYGQNVLSHPLVLHVQDSTGRHDSFPGDIPKVKTDSYKQV